MVCVMGGSLSAEWIFQLRPKDERGRMKGGWVFHAEERASAKPWHKKGLWCSRNIKEAEKVVNFLR